MGEDRFERLRKNCQIKYRNLLKIPKKLKLISKPWSKNDASERGDTLATKLGEEKLVNYFCLPPCVNNNFSNISIHKTSCSRVNAKTKFFAFSQQI